MRQRREGATSPPAPMKCDACASCEKDVGVNYVRCIYGGPFTWLEKNRQEEPPGGVGVVLRVTGADTPREDLLD